MYRHLVEGVIDYAIYMLHPDGTVANWNAGAERAKGYTRKEIVGRHFSCFYTDEERERGLPEHGLTQARDQGRHESEGWRVRKDGTLFWANVVIDAIHDDDGVMLGYTKITRDCTEQRRLMLELQASERTFRLLVQGVTDYAIYMLDVNGHVVNWNAGAQRIKGYQSSEVVGKHFSLFYAPADQAAGLPQRALEIACRDGRYESEGQRVRKDGSLLWTHVVIDAIHDDDGTLLGYTKITRDVTERRERNRQLVQAKELAERYSAEMASLSTFLETVVAHIPSGVIVQDALTRKILLVNRQAELLTGQSRATLQQGSVRDHLPEEMARHFERLTDEALRGTGVRHDEEELPTARGNRTLRTETLVFHGADPRSRYVLLVANDVTDENAAHAQIRYMAHHDTLTGMPNRRLFRERLLHGLQKQASDKLTAVLCLDLDNFKSVNDTLGHQFGDELLRSLAKRLPRILREGDTLARLGGDEFAIILPGLDREEDIREIALRLIEAVRPAFHIDGHTLTVGVSVGIAVAAHRQGDADQLLRHADMALYEAKRNGRNRLAFFEPQMEHEARARREMETDLRQAIISNQLQLHYQPIADQSHNRIVGREALVRWEHPTKGMIMPNDFIPIAEGTGLIHELGAFVLHEACREAARWPPHESVAVNLSACQFSNSALVSLVESALATSGLPPQRLELEVTESVLLANSEANVATLNRLKQIGVRVALDDFGTGYSSLGYLRSFAFDKIKIDKSFTQDVETSREALAIIRAINGIGRSLDIPTTAEGVETNGQIQRLTQEGCTHFQGYLIGRPVAHARGGEVPGSALVPAGG